MSQINIFNGGLNTRVSPTLLQTQESTECINVDLSRGSLQSSKSDTAHADTVTSNLYWFNKPAVWVSSTQDRSYVEFQEKLYYSDSTSIPQKSSDGVTWKNLGITGPANAPVLGAHLTGALNGTYQYCYTYYNSLDGTESMPSPYSAEYLTTSGVSIDVLVSTDTQVDKIRLYRLGGALTVMTLVVELTNATQQYLDELGDISIIGSVLSSQGNGQAISGLTNLVEANAMFFGSKGSTLYYSDIGYVNNWNPFNFIVFDDIITGIGTLQTGILVFTKYKTYIVTGNSPEALSKYLLNGNQGCILHKSIKYINNTLIWLSSDGLCYSNGNDIKVGTRDKLNKLDLVNPSCAMVYDDVYYISHSEGTLAVDTRFGFAISTYSITPDSFAIKNDILYYSKTNVLYSFATGNTDKQLTFKTPSFSDGATSSIKTYKSVYVNMEYGTFAISIYIDDTLVSSHVITKASDIMLIPHDKTQGYYISFKLVGVGAIREIEYKAQGRQNGR